MPWYFYNGRVPVPVKREDGVVVSVPPRGHVEASPQDVRKFGSKMRRCAPPAEEVKKAALTPPTVIAPPTKTSPLSEAVRERGVTHAPGTPPVRKDLSADDQGQEDDSSESSDRRSRTRKATSNTNTASKK